MLKKQLKMDEAERIAAFYRKHGKEPPKVFEHGTEADIKAGMVELKPTRWWQEGNELKGETELGITTTLLPTDTILVGVDEDNLPIFRKVVI